MKQILAFVLSVSILLLTACGARGNEPMPSVNDPAGAADSISPRQEESVSSSAGKEASPAEETPRPSQPSEPQSATATPPAQKPTQPTQPPQKAAEAKPSEPEQPSEAPVEPTDTPPESGYTQADFDRIISEVRAYAESYAAQGFRFIWTDGMAFSQDVGYFGTPYLRYEGVDGTISRLQYHVDKIVQTSTDPANGMTVSEMSYKVVQLEQNGEIAFAVIYGG